MAEDPRVDWAEVAGAGAAGAGEAAGPQSDPPHQRPQPEQLQRAQQSQPGSGLMVVGAELGVRAGQEALPLRGPRVRAVAALK